ncbi:MAG: asparagine synthase (glutamine-hydrolyzing) [Deltaproteobacteria bacterium]|nr:asparagine synthase (glutamine-hydrolyzing) [Deltaproteobacteria bacterium]
MCGICGIISRRRPVAEIRSLLERMNRLQAHRGPDDEACAVYEAGPVRVGFGFVRLAILDLETGMQPVGDGDGSALVCNGQLYNYLELKKELDGVDWRTRGDAEVALQRLRRFSPERALNDFNGMYAGAFYDAPGRRLVLFRDRFGIKPLYYRELDGELSFASEIKPLLALGPAPVREELFPTLLTYRYLPGEETIFAGIRRLPPGSFLVCDLESGAFRVENYWQNLFPPLIGPEREISLYEAREEFLELFFDAVSLRLRSDVEVGSFLSGGIDSAAVAAAAALRVPDLSLFTIAFREAVYNELDVVRDFLAAREQTFAGTRHHSAFCGPESLAGLPQLIRSLEEPIFLGAVLPTDQVCETASKRVKTVLTGEGADEIFAGYRKFLVEMAAIRYRQAGSRERDELERAYPELKDYLARRAADPLARYIQSEALFSPAELDRLLVGRKAEIPIRGLEELGAAPRLTGREHPLNAALAVESRCRLPDYVILRLDKLSMRHSLETRTPFLDYRLAEFAARLPVSFKINLAEGREKYLCRRAFSASGLLDNETAWRRKQPFTSPLADWLADRKKWPEEVAEALAGGMIARHGILDPAMVAELTRRVTTAGVGPATLVSGADRLFAVLVFTLWYEEFACG